MSLLQLALLALIQGVTEWLPISSSGHVLLASAWFGVEGTDELLINALAHVGTLIAILIYFRADVWRSIRGGFQLVGIGKPSGGMSSDARLALLIIAATPIAIIIIAAFTLLDEAMVAAVRSLWVVIAATVGFGLLLWWADVRGATDKTEADMPLRHAVLIGAVQGIAAIFPGTSRSGITMTAARWLGYSRTEAARFAMLIGAPLLAAAGAYAIIEFLEADPATLSITTTGAVFVVVMSFVSGLASIWGLMALLQRMSFLPFVIYRLLLGAALLLMSPLGLGLVTP